MTVMKDLIVDFVEKLKRIRNLRKLLKKKINYISMQKLKRKKFSMHEGSKDLRL